MSQASVSAGLKREREEVEDNGRDDIGPLPSDGHLSKKKRGRSRCDNVVSTL